MSTLTTDINEEKLSESVISFTYILVTVVSVRSNLVVWNQTCTAYYSQKQRCGGPRRVGTTHLDLRDNTNSLPCVNVRPRTGSKLVCYTVQLSLISMNMKV